MIKKGTECQRLGTTTWNNLKYREVEKSLEASPISTALKINPQLANATPKWCSSENIIKLDQTCAVFKHVLLLQRQAFEEGIQKVAQEAGITSVAESIHRNLLSKESKFRKLSDKAIQYACGRRADAIATRRSFYKPPNIGLDSLLKSIPPSLTHLFDEEKLTECIRQKVFSDKNTINQRIRTKIASTAQSVANKQVQKSPIQAGSNIPKRNPILRKKLLKAENSDYRGFVAGGLRFKTKHLGRNGGGEIPFIKKPPVINLSELPTHLWETNFSTTMQSEIQEMQTMGAIEQATAPSGFLSPMFLKKSQTAPSDRFPKNSG
ncbi:Iron(III) dicitrate-binding protein [Operophtera brumata]|uniref:Iron(III) dicitrate-binding protein n=1 Tax=Operophtera brumata TaxID=104452 RepID=A0A0L7LAI3_OPEBR|nr:Iron(III) dicitrate-binding protein [Operophtera brumata]